MPDPAGSTKKSTYEEEHWREFLTQGDSMLHFGRRVFTHLPSSPRCRLCTAPFGGIGGPVMRLIGKGPSPANPNMCMSCANALIRHHGGAEVEGTMLFADIRGSTALAERMTPAEFHGLLDRYFATATKVVFDHDGFIDKFVGDELVALFFPLLSGERHTVRAVACAQALLRATGHADPDGPWVPIGAGINYGTAWFGAVGDGTHAELTAVGDAVNVAARLAAAAGGGEVLVSAAAAEAAGLDPAFERRSLDLKGKQATVEAISLRVA